MKKPKRSRCLIFDYDITWDNISIRAISELLDTTQKRVKEWRAHGMTTREANLYEKFTNAARNEAAHFQNSKQTSPGGNKFTEDELLRIRKFARMLHQKEKDSAARESQIEAEHREKQKLYLERLKNQ